MNPESDSTGLQKRVVKADRLFKILTMLIGYRSAVFLMIFEDEGIINRFLTIPALDLIMQVRGITLSGIAGMCDFEALPDPLAGAHQHLVQMQVQGLDAFIRVVDFDAKPVLPGIPVGARYPTGETRKDGGSHLSLEIGAGNTGKSYAPRLYFL